VVEAVPEDLELKKQIFARVDRIVTEDAILATNTSVGYRDRRCHVEPQAR